MSKQRIFIDMDGTLAVFEKGNSMEQVCSPGYFLHLKPIENMIFATKRLVQDENFEIFILSHVLSDRAETEKHRWLDMFLPEIERNHRIFVPCEKGKEKSVPAGIRQKDVLLDDYTKNLKEWTGIGIKVLNGINGTNGTWRGRAVTIASDPCILYQSIAALARF